jgi:putative transposase
MYNPLKHHRRSIRLEGYDYSKEGFYFVTLGSRDQMQLFGKIKNCEFFPSKIGTILEDRWLRIPEFFETVVVHEFVLMPDHMHGIIEIAGDVLSSRTADIESLFEQRSWKDNFVDQKTGFRSPSGTIGSIVRGFKFGVYSDYKMINGKSSKLFQRDYYEEIIKDYGSYIEIKSYIKNNVKNYDIEKGE